MALVTVLFVMLVALTAGMVVMDRVASMAVESNQRIKEQQAFLLAEAGLDNALLWLNTSYKQPIAALLDVTQAPVRLIGGGDLSLVPFNHPTAYQACADGTQQNGVSAATVNANLGVVNANLGTQARVLGSGTYEIIAIRLLTARVNCFGTTTIRDRDEMWEIKAKGTYQTVERQVTALMQRQQLLPFDYGLFARNQLTVRSNVLTRSFDSSTATWNPAASSGLGAWSSEFNGSAPVGTNAGTASAIVVDANSTINGKATPGPGAVNGAVSLQGNSVVTDSLSPAANTKTLNPPAPAGSCCSSLPAGVTANGITTYTLPPGHYGNVTMDNSTQVLVLSADANATYSFTSLTIKDASLTLAGAAPTFKVTVTNTLAVEGGTARVNQGGKPTRLEVNIMANTSANTQNPDSGNSSVVIKSTAQFFGTIYAPNAKVWMDSNVRLYGAVIADRLLAQSNTLIYYDRDLLKKDVGGSGDLIVPFFASNL